MRRARTQPQPAELSPAGRRALASFLAGRLPAGQLYDELCRSRTAEVAVVTVAPPLAGTARAA